MAATRTKASEVFGAYGTRPLDLHGDWYLVSCHARLIGMELIAHCKDPADLRLPVGPDWRETLCAKLCISGPDRRNAKAAMDKLVGAGFLHPEDGFVRVTLVPLRIQSGSTSVPLRFHSGSSPDPNQAKPVEIIQGAEPSRKEGRLTSEGERAGARSHAEVFREPLPEPPPNVEPAEQPLGEWIASEHAKRFVARTGASPGGSNRYQLARDIGRWVEGNSGAYKLGNRQLATKLLDGLFASERASSKRWPLSWILQDPTEFCGTPKAVETPAAKQSVSSPTHREWTPPDYERDRREADAASLRRQEEWFAQHPEFREEVAEYEREWAERLAAEKEAKRVVVPIGEAKPQVRAYRPKTPEELEARRRELAEQERQIRAANAAK